MTRDELKEKVARAIRFHVKVDATGLTPVITSHWLFGFEKAAEATLSAIEAEGMAVVPVNTLREMVCEEVYSAYHAGIAVNGEWMDGGRSEGQWLRRQLGLEDGRHPMKSVWDALPELVERRVKKLQVTAMVEAGRLK